MVLNGRFYGFEVKRPKVGRPTKIQEITIQAINSAGGIAAVVSYPKDVERILEGG